jgi:HEPN domain-containing protein
MFTQNYHVHQNIYNTNFFINDGSNHQELNTWKERLVSIIEKLPSEEMDLAPVIQLLVSAIAPAQIYRWSSPPPNGKDEERYIHLLLIISPRCTTPFTELEPVLEFAYLKDSRVSCSLHQYSHAKEGLQKGYVFYSLALQPQNLIYDSKELELPQVPAEALEKLKKESMGTFEGYHKRAKQFLQCATELHEQLSPLVAFMLQQTAELTLRGVLLSLNGYDKKTHELPCLLKHLRRCAPPLQDVFPADTEEEKQLLQTLENAYVASRYQLDFSLPEEKLQLLFSRVTHLLQSATQIVNNVLSKF